ncbi:MAG: DUF59 domain-containing protein [Bacteroidales bacterium]|nr:DUF59 domain-containing protein [Bacteroidales bacterium]
MNQDNTTVEQIERDAVIAALKQVYDPEIPVDVYELGLIYDIKIEGTKVSITMTLTAPNCPIADEVVEQVRNGVYAVRGVSDVDVQLVFEPEWTPERMSEEARLMLNMY